MIQASSLNSMYSQNAMTSSNGLSNATIKTNNETDQMEAAAGTGGIIETLQSSSEKFVSDGGDTLDISEQGMALSAGMTSDTETSAATTETTDTDSDDELEELEAELAAAEAAQEEAEAAAEQAKAEAEQSAAAAEAATATAKGASVDTTIEAASTSSLEAESQANQENAKVTLSSVTSDDEDSDEDTTSLSTYSEYELSQMLSEGTISASEYNAELKRREDSESEKQSVQEAKDKAYAATQAAAVDPTNVRFQLEI